MPGALVPVGTRYHHARTPSAAALQVLGEAWAPYSCELLSSGTAALTLALRAARVARGLDRGEVVIPAYACPSLVSAAVAAKCDVVLIDTARHAWGYDLAALEAAFSPRTTAVLAVDLFGIGDQVAELDALCAPRGVTLIQDSAQSMPLDVAAWRCDFVVLSFGRGKPLNLLGGGALLRRPADDAVQARLQAALDAQLAALPVNDPRPLRRDLLGLAYNALTNPAAYSLARRMPGLHIGETAYEIPGDESRLHAANFGNLAATLQAYQKQRATAQDSLSRAIPRLRAAGFSPLPGSRWPESSGTRLLRFPLLAGDGGLAARAHELLEERGLGSSRMYVTTLPQIAGMPETIARQGPFANASDLAQRLLTLPVHHRVSDTHVHAIVDALSRAAGVR